MDEQGSGERAIGEDTTTADEPDPLRKWLLRVVIAVAGLALLQILSDRTAPYTSLATVEGLVMPVAFRVGGEIEGVSIRDNQVVEQGATLVRLDTTPYRIAVEAAEAQLAQVGQSIGVSTEQVAAAEARLAQARSALSNTRAQSARTLELVSRGVLPKARGDTAQKDLETATSEVVAAQAALRAAEAALGPRGETNPLYRSASASLERTRYDLASTTLISPTRGYVTNLRIGEGQVVQAGQPLMTLIDLSGAWIMAHFRENQIGAIKVGDKVSIILEAQPGRVLSGRVASMAGGLATPTLTAPSGGLVTLPSTFLRDPQRFAVKIEFDPPDVIPDAVRVGSQATVMVRTGSSIWLAPIWWIGMRLTALFTYVYGSVRS